MTKVIKKQVMKTSNKDLIVKNLGFDISNSDLYVIFSPIVLTALRKCLQNMVPLQSV